MPAAIAFFKFVARAALNAVGGGIAGDFAVEVLPDVAREVWQRWGQGRPEGELRQELQEVAQVPSDEGRRLAEQAAVEEAAGLSEPARGNLVAYLSQVPTAIRQSQRRTADPGGRTVSSSLSLRRPESLLPLLPTRLPHFKPGDRPAGIGDWELEELLGVGGFGEVWKARNPHLPTPVALKFCLDPTAAQWLRHEAALLGRVISQGTHPGIVRLQHTYLSAATPCLQYEYVAGGDLSSLITQWHRKPVDSLVDQVTRLMRRLAEIVGFAHRLDPPIVHRDLKPANILLQRASDGRVSPRVADFGIGGIAARQAVEQTRRGTTKGQFLATALRGACTPLYASPQQMRGEAPDPRDDVFSLGVIWHQLLTGDMESGSPSGSGWRKRLAERGMAVPLIELLEGCIEDNSNDRPADVAVLAERLAALLAPSRPTPGQAETELNQEMADFVAQHAPKIDRPLQPVSLNVDSPAPETKPTTTGAARPTPPALSDTHTGDSSEARARLASHGPPPEPPPITAAATALPAAGEDWHYHDTSGVIRGPVPAAELLAPAPPVPSTAAIAAEVPVPSPFARLGSDDDDPLPRRRRPLESKAAHRLGIASMVLGAVALLFSLIPCVGMLSIPLSGLGLLLGVLGGIVALFRGGTGIGFPIAGSALSAMALLIGAFWFHLADTTSETLRNLTKKSKETNQEVVGDSPRSNGPDYQTKNPPEKAEEVETEEKFLRLAREAQEKREGEAKEKAARGERRQDEAEIKRREEEAKRWAEAQKARERAEAEAAAQEAEGAAARKLKLAKQLKDAEISAKAEGKTVEEVRMRQAAWDALLEIVRKYPNTKAAEEARELLGNKRAMP
jgi:serine/threonine protein kinase